MGLAGHAVRCVSLVFAGNEAELISIIGLRLDVDIPVFEPIHDN